MNYVFMTDSDSDLPYDLKVKYDIPVVYMPYALDGKEYFDDLGQSLDHKAYYKAMREGAVPVTSALNEDTYIEYFEPILEKSNLLFLAFSSQMSSTIQAMRSAREKLLAKYPTRRFEIFDTLSISGPQTLLILGAHKLYREGATMDEVLDWLGKNYDRAQAYFAVDDLKYLKRGGRISPTAATFGNMLDLKPIITEARDGKLISISKVRGKRKAISCILDKVEENLEDPKESIAIILHADCYADAELIKKEMQARQPELEMRIDNVGPVIGAHCGPGTFAFCFMGKHRPY